MEFVHIFTVLVLSLCHSKVYCRPQWRQTSVDSFDPNKSFSISKTLDFNNKRSSIGGTLGYDRTSGFGLGVKGSHTFGKGTTLYGSTYKSQRGGSTNTLGFNQKFKTGTIYLDQILTSAVVVQILWDSDKILENVHHYLDQEQTQTLMDLKFVNTTWD